MHDRAAVRAVARCVLPCPGSVSEHFLACKGAFDAPAHNLDGGVRYAAAAQALKKISRSTLKWIEMLQHIQKNAARTGGDDFEREFALLFELQSIQSDIVSTPTH